MEYSIVIMLYEYLTNHPAYSHQNGHINENQPSH